MFGKDEILMKKLFKKAIASLLATAIAVTSLVTGVSAAEFSVSGATDNKVQVNVGATAELTVTTDEAAITAKSAKESIATATVDAKKVTIKGVAAGTTDVTISDGKATPVKIAVTVKRVPAVASTVKLYTDSACANEVSAETGVSVYVNGTKTKVEPIVDYKTTTLYFKENSAVKKMIATTTTGSEPKLTEKGALPSDDAGIKEAKDMAVAKVDLKKKTVAISAGKKTSDAKTVTAWVFGLNEYNEVVTKASAKVVVKGAATSISFYATAPQDKTPVAKTITIGSKSADNRIYFTSAIKAPSKDATNTITDNTFKVEADPKVKDVTVAYDAKNAYFTVTAKSLVPDSKKKVKTLSAKIKVTCVQSGKSATITVIVENDVNSITNTIGTGYATLIDEKGDVAKVDVAPTRDDSTIATTSKVSVVVLDGETAFDAKGKLTTAKSKSFGAKLQNTDTGYRVRITNSGAKEPKNAVVYLVVTNAAKETKYLKVATLTKAGAVTKA